jgi:hypothetical protein
MLKCQASATSCSREFALQRKRSASHSRYGQAVGIGLRCLSTLVSRQGKGPVWGDALTECVRACATGQKMEVLQETLHLHRKRVTKLYKKVDLQQKDLNDAKDAYQCSQDRILELKTALQV